MRSKEKRGKCWRARSIAATRLGDAVAAAEKAKRVGIERLHAERDAVDPGGADIAEATGLDRSRIGLERDLGFGGEGPALRDPLDQRRDRFGRHQRRRAAAEEDRRHDPPACFGSVMVELGEQGAAPTNLVDRGSDMAVEVAIRAFRLAERPMDVDREGRDLRPIPGRRFDQIPAKRRGAGHRGASKHAATSFWKASARWLMRCFSS